MIPPPGVTDSLPQECEESVLGDSVSFCREFFGDQDAVIEGQVEGSPNSQERLITSGSRGRIKVDIHVRRVVVHGLVGGIVAAIDKTAIQRIGEDPAPWWCRELLSRMAFTSMGASGSFGRSLRILCSRLPRATRPAGNEEPSHEV
jgi:hypothetical protein